MSVLVGVRTRSARLSKKELLVHGTSIPPAMLHASAADLSTYDDVLALLPGPDLMVRSRAAVAWQDQGPARVHLTNDGVSGGSHHSPLKAFTAPMTCRMPAKTSGTRNTGRKTKKPTPRVTIPRMT